MIRVECHFKLSCFLQQSRSESLETVIHATNFRFDVEGEFEDSYVKPVLYFYGTEKGKEWRAVLDIIRYVDVGVSYTDWN